MTTELEPHRKPLTLALRLLFLRWIPWIGDDEVLAVDVAFDSFNTEICVSLLTNREPRAVKMGIDLLKEPWDVDSWRLTGINKTASHCFPDVADLVSLMNNQARKEETTETELACFNESLKRFFFEVVSSHAVVAEILRFPHSDSIQIRVHWFFEQTPPLQHKVRRAAT